MSCKKIIVWTILRSRFLVFDSTTCCERPTVWCTSCIPAVADSVSARSRFYCVIQCTSWRCCYDCCCLFHCQYFTALIFDCSNIFTARIRSCGKVMFTVMYVCQSVSLLTEEGSPCDHCKLIQTCSLWGTLLQTCSNLFTCNPYVYCQAGSWPSSERPSCLGNYFCRSFILLLRTRSWTWFIFRKWSELRLINRRDANCSRFWCIYTERNVALWWLIRELDVLYTLSGCYQSSLSRSLSVNRRLDFT